MEESFGNDLIQIEDCPSVPTKRGRDEDGDDHDDCKRQALSNDDLRLSCQLDHEDDELDDDYYDDHDLSLLNNMMTNSRFAEKHIDETTFWNNETTIVRRNELDLLYPPQTGDVVFGLELMMFLKRGPWYRTFFVKNKCNPALEANKWFVAKIGVAKCLDNEFEVYEKVGSHPNVCSVVWFKKWTVEQVKRKNRNQTKLITWRLLILEKLGQNLEKPISYFLRTEKLPVDTRRQLLNKLAVEMISSVEHVHRAGQLHRGIKPDNFVLPADDSLTKVILIDFGKCRSYQWVDKNGQLKHRWFRQVLRPVDGSPIWPSIHHHKGIRRARRDDLISLGYVFVYMWQGRLPWNGINYTDYNEMCRKIQKMKEELSLEQLCELPTIRRYMEIVLALKFKQQPNYDKLRQIFIIDENKSNQ